MNKPIERAVGFVLVGLAAVVAPLLAQPKKGFDLPTPDLAVSVEANGAVRVSNVGDAAAKVPPFHLSLKCKNVKAGRGSSVDSPPACGVPFAGGFYGETIQSLKPGAPNPSNPCGQTSQFLSLDYPGSLVVCLPISSWAGGDFEITAKVNDNKAFYEKSEANNTAAAVVHVAAKRPAPPMIRKSAVTPRTEKKQ